MRSERQKVDQANSSLLEYKNFFYMRFGSLAPGKKIYREKLKNCKYLEVFLKGQSVEITK